jgi:hypothetical protein
MSKTSAIVLAPSRAIVSDDDILRFNSEILSDMPRPVWIFEPRT